MALSLSLEGRPKDRNLKERDRIIDQEAASEGIDEDVAEDEEVAEAREKEKHMKVKPENPMSSEVKDEEEADGEDDKREGTDLRGIMLGMGKLGNK